MDKILKLWNRLNKTAKIAVVLVAIAIIYYLVA